MKSHRITAALVIAVAIAFSGGSARAEEDELDPVAMAKLLPDATIPLQRALKASEREGKPISGKYEIEKGALRLSVYTVRGDGFLEVVVDYNTAGIKKSEKITDAEDLDDAKSQSLAMSKSKLSLDTVVENATKANTGYRAVSIVPAIVGGAVPMATVILMKGTEVKKVTQQLD